MSLPDKHFFFASDAVTDGHPDKLCDQIADTILDACLAQDPEARVACEACTKTGMVMVLGDVTTKARVNYEQLIREVARSAGYDSDDKGLDWRTMNVIVAIEEKTPDVAQTLMLAGPSDNAGARGIVCGYATDETPEAMPLTQRLASCLCTQLDTARRNGDLGWAYPSGSVQVIVEHRETSEGAVVPVNVRSISVSVRHGSDVKADQLERDLMEYVVKPVRPMSLCTDKTSYYFGSLKVANSDTGFSGRRLVSDTYGGWGSQCDGSLSGLDGAQLARCGSYGARWVAKSLVDMGLCKRCLVQLTYLPDSAVPAAVHVNSYGTARACARSDAELSDIVTRKFDLRCSSLHRDLSLKEPRFQKLSAYGHFGRRDLQLPWERSRSLQ